MSAPYRVPVSRLAVSEATVPGSKSLTNRALLLAALADGTSELTGVLDSEDARLMLESLQALGIEIDFDPDACRAVVKGRGGDFPVKSAELYVGNSGTTARFLTAALAFADGGEYRIDGKPRMRERPIGDLLTALSALGCDVVAEAGNDCPPLVIRGKRDVGGEIGIAANVSSQFLSGLLMAAPLAKRGVVVNIDGDLSSRPYVAMTLETMRAFGVAVESDAAFRRFSGFDSGAYRGRVYAIEPDASAASYFFALPAILGGEITIRGLSRRSLQGDVGFVDCLAQMGCDVRWDDDAITVERKTLADGTLAPLTGIDVDMNEISDVAQTLSVVALFADSPTRIRNVAHMRRKETDRVSAVATELRKFGVRVDEFEDGLQIWAGPDVELNGAKIATYDDHRMAMSFALAGLRIRGVEIEDPGCVAKTYPNFFADLEKATRPVDAD